MADEPKKKKKRVPRKRDFKDCETKAAYATQEEAEEAEPDKSPYPCSRCGLWHVTTPLVYEFGLHPPHVNGKLVSDQMYFGHRYRNTLVEIERRRRAEVLTLLTDPGIETELQAAIRAKDEAFQAIKATRKITRSRSESKEQRQKLKELGSAVKEVSVRARVFRQDQTKKEAVQIGLAWINMMAFERVRVARNASGVAYGSYLLHEKAMKQSAAKSKSEPAFVRWSGDGLMGVQLQGGLDQADAWGADRRLQFVRAGKQEHPAPSNHTQGRGRRQGRATTIRFRVGSEGRNPIWAESTMIMHRPLPELGEITWATVTRKQLGSTTWWKVHITVDDSPTRPCPADGAVALNLGWARRDDGSIRAGFVVGSDGWTHEIVLPLRDIKEFKRVDSLQAIRDHNLNDIKSDLSRWIAEQKALPEWFVEATRYLALTRAPKKLYALRMAWQVGWWEEGATGYDMLEAWMLGKLYSDNGRWRRRGGDVHLERWATSARETTLLRRREGYRVLAADLARRYRTLVLDDTDLRKFAKRATPADEDIDHEGTTARRYQQKLACPSELRLAMTNGFGSSRTEIHKAVNISRRHRDHLTERDDEARLIRCSGCGEIIDQDANACRNLLGEWERAGRDRESARRA